MEVTESKGGFGGGYTGASRFDEMTHFGSSYGTPGWQRAQRNKDAARRRRRLRRGRRRIFSATIGSDRATASPPPDRGRVRAGAVSGRRQAAPRLPLTIEGELVAKSTGTVSDFAIGDRVFHQKFGNGNVTAIDGNKLTIQFDKAGEKRVVDSFVERV